MDSNTRQRIAHASARLIIEEGITDYHAAKCKAAAQLGITNSRYLPSNSEIEAEIILYQRLFKADTHSQNLQHLRQISLQVMQLCQAFTPRLVGSVLEGTAHIHSDITLHLFSDSAEEIAWLLMDKRIPYELGEKRFRMSQTLTFPTYTIHVEGVAVILIIFSIKDMRWSPPSPVDGKPMKRADKRAVEKLLVAVGE